MKVTDVNFNGSIYFARIASVYLRQSSSSDTSKSTDRSLTLVSSVAESLESPSLFVYSASKHGVIGLMQSLRKSILHFFSIYINYYLIHVAQNIIYSSSLTKTPIKIFPTFDQPIRTNCICPWMTKTGLVSDIEEKWETQGLPTNTPMDVAGIIAGMPLAFLSTSWAYGFVIVLLC
jgi:NAD(P)-dependent dehydrogenase (short-subunit alcohol dehydrogenase family)